MEHGMIKAAVAVLFDGMENTCNSGRDVEQWTPAIKHLEAHDGTGSERCLIVTLVLRTGPFEQCPVAIGVGTVFPNAVGSLRLWGRLGLITEQKCLLVEPNLHSSGK